MRKILASIAGLAALGSLAVAPSPAAASDCSGTLYGTVVAAGPVYVDVRSVMTDGYLWSIWIYVEDNGIAGLQRGGADPLGSPDTCQDWGHNPDMLIY